MSLSSFNPRTRDLQRLLVGNASDVEIDGAGRILLPAPLRKFAGLEKDVALVGQGVRFELWDEAKWAAQMDKSIALNERRHSTGAGGIFPLSAQASAGSAGRGARRTRT